MNNTQFEIRQSKEIEFCQEYKYLGVFYVSGTEDKEIRSRVNK